MKLPILLFDAAGVIFPANTAVGDSLQAKFKFTEEQNRELWSNIYPAYSTGSISTDQFLSKFAALMGISVGELSQQTFTGPFEQALEPIPGMNDLFQTLHSKGYQLTLLSDTSEIFAQIIGAHGYYKPFDKKFLSYETGYLKSDSRAFSVVLKEYRVKPGNVLFIDDNPKNIAVASQLGIEGLVFTDSTSLKSALIEKGII